MLYGLHDPSLNLCKMAQPVNAAAPYLAGSGKAISWRYPAFHRIYCQWLQASSRQDLDG